ncbi:Piwi domain-containing protein, partial [Trichostrongylus colubriformis]
MAGRRSTTVVMMDQKKQPAKRTGKEEELISNFWELTVQNKIVYRYDVAVFLGTRTNSKAVNYLRGPRDDSALVARRRACLCALQLALERYRILSEGSEFVYDGSAMMFSSEDLAPALKKHHGLLTVNMSDLPVQLSKQTKFYCPDGDSFTIEISRCRDSAESLNMADLSAHMNNNWAALNRSLNQFYELLVTRDAVIRGHFTQYGIGCLYNQLASGDVGCGYERFNGVRKGIKFIEGKRTNDVVPAVVLDHRTGLFFKSQPLIKSVRELDGLQSVEQFDFSDFNGRMNTMWNKVNEYVKGIRMTYVGLNSKPISAVAIGISKVPISEAKDFVNRDEESVLERYSDGRVPINPYWPAVKLLVRNKVACFPMEAVQVEPNQRVPIEKQQMAKCVRKTDKPEVRLATITKLLEALNLHQQGSQNKFLKAFQVSVSPSPIIVKAFRRQPPAILHGGKQASAVDDLKFKWRQNGSTPYVEGGRVDRIILVYSDRSIPTASWEALQKLLKTRGVQFGKMEQLIISYSNSLDMEKQLTDCFNKVSAERKQFRKSAFIVFIDRAENKSHDFLKLLERKYRIPTQHITAEIACALSTKPQCCLNVVSKMNLKLGGMNYEVVPEAFSQNIWISKGKTLIVGYDVAHPGKPTRDEVMNKMPPQKPSVVGFSFNGAQHREKFIGDYHFQTPRREQVDHCVLNSRFKWMLGLFTKNRKTWPESVIVTR